MEDNQDQEEKPDGVYEAMIDLLVSRFEKVYQVNQMTSFITTEQIHDKMQEIYPSMFYGPGTVARSLHDRGFRMTIVGNMEFIWLIRLR